MLCLDSSQQTEQFLDKFQNSQAAQFIHSCSYNCYHMYNQIGALYLGHWYEYEIHKQNTKTCNK